MFSSLRQDSLIYVLNKKDSPILSIGRVISVSAPTPKYPTTFTNPINNIESTVDITVNIDGNNYDFKKIPSQLSIYGDNNAVISETRDAMASEIETMRSNSQNIIDSIDYHKKIIECCSNMLEQLNPNLAKEREQENRLNNLESKLGNIESSLAELSNFLKKGKE